MVIRCYHENLNSVICHKPLVLSYNKRIEGIVLINHSPGTYGALRFHVIDSPSLLSTQWNECDLCHCIRCLKACCGYIFIFRSHTLKGYSEEVKYNVKVSWSLSDKQAEYLC